MSGRGAFIRRRLSCSRRFLSALVRLMFLAANESKGVLGGFSFGCACASGIVTSIPYRLSILYAREDTINIIRSLTERRQECELDYECIAESVTKAALIIESSFEAVFQSRFGMSLTLVCRGGFCGLKATMYERYRVEFQRPLDRPFSRSRGFPVYGGIRLFKWAFFMWRYDTEDEFGITTSTVCDVPRPNPAWCSAGGSMKSLQPLPPGEASGFRGWALFWIPGRERGLRPPFDAPLHALNSVRWCVASRHVAEYTRGLPDAAICVATELRSRFGQMPRGLVMIEHASMLAASMPLGNVYCDEDIRSYYADPNGEPLPGPELFVALTFPASVYTAQPLPPGPQAALELPKEPGSD